MKKPSTREPSSRRRDMRAEYRFDYGVSRPNRFAAHAAAGAVAALLEPGIARVFHDSGPVNAVLRSVISAVPGAAAPKPRTARKPASPAVPAVR